MVFYVKTYSLSDELHTSTLEVLVLLCVFKLFMEYISNCFNQKLFVFGLKFSLSYLNFFFIFLFILKICLFKASSDYVHIKIFGFLIKTAVSCSLLNLIIFFQLFFNLIYLKTKTTFTILCTQCVITYNLYYY